MDKVDLGKALEFLRSDDPRTKKIPGYRRDIPHIPSDVLDEVKSKYCTVFDDPTDEALAAAKAVSEGEAAADEIRPVALNQSAANDPSSGDQIKTSDSTASTSSKSAEELASNNAVKSKQEDTTSAVDPAITRNIILAQLAKKSSLVSVDTEAID